MRKFIVVATAIAALAVPAATGADNYAGNEASYSGMRHGAFANVNGNFGRIGTEFGGAPYFSDGVWAVGQMPGATGYNNSHVIGLP